MAVEQHPSESGAKVMNSLPVGLAPGLLVTRPSALRNKGLSTDWRKAVSGLSSAATSYFGGSLPAAGIKLSGTLLSAGWLKARPRRCAWLGFPRKPRQGDLP